MLTLVNLKVELTKDNMLGNHLIEILQHVHDMAANWNLQFLDDLEKEDAYEISIYKVKNTEFMLFDVDGLETTFNLFNNKELQIGFWAFLSNQNTLDLRKHIGLNLNFKYIRLLKILPDSNAYKYENNILHAYKYPTQKIKQTILSIALRLSRTRTLQVGNIDSIHDSDLYSNYTLNKQVARPFEKIEYWKRGAYFYNVYEESEGIPIKNYAGYSLVYSTRLRKELDNYEASLAHNLLRDRQKNSGH